MVLEGNLSTGNQSYPGTAQLQEPGLIGEGHRRDHGPGKGQAFLLTEAAIHIATSNLTLIQTFLVGGDLNPTRQEGGSKRKLHLGVWEGTQSLAKGTVDGAQHCRAGPAKLLGMFGVAVAESR